MPLRDGQGAALPCPRHIDRVIATPSQPMRGCGKSGAGNIVSDIFHEVDEEVRREQLKKLWERYGNYFAAAAILVVVAVGAWRGYSWWEAKKAAQSGAAFESAISLADAGKHSEAEAAFAQIGNDGTSGYRK